MTGAPNRAAARRAIEDLLASRDPGKTICPSDAARALGGDDGFRPLMDTVRAAAQELVEAGRVEVTQKGKKVDLDTVKGPVRLGAIGTLAERQDEAPAGEPGDFDLDRFIDAQDAGGTYDAALAELRAGRKTTHWMWFVFPQIEGLGRSPTARHYAVASLLEARAYLSDPTLGARLRESAAALLSHDDLGAEAILGPVDALKLRSSMTLFARADPAEPLFAEVLERFYGGEADPATEERI